MTSTTTLAAVATACALLSSIIDGGAASTALFGLQTSAFSFIAAAPSSFNCSVNCSVSCLPQRSVVTFTSSISDADGGFGAGAVFPVILCLGSLALHSILVLGLALLRWCRGTTVHLENKEDGKDSSAFSQHLQFAALQLRFPHWWLWLSINIVYPSLLFEAASVLSTSANAQRERAPDDIALAVAALVLAALLILVVLIPVSTWGVYQNVEMSSLHRMLERLDLLPTPGGDWDWHLVWREQEEERARELLEAEEDRLFDALLRGDDPESSQEEEEQREDETDDEDECGNLPELRDETVSAPLPLAPLIDRPMHFVLYRPQMRTRQLREQFYGRFSPSLTISNDDAGENEEERGEEEHQQCDCAIMCPIVCNGNSATMCCHSLCSGSTLRFPSCDHFCCSCGTSSLWQHLLDMFLVAAASRGNWNSNRSFVALYGAAFTAWNPLAAFLMPTLMHGVLIPAVATSAALQSKNAARVCAGFQIPVAAVLLLFRPARRPLDNFFMALQLLIGAGGIALSSETLAVREGSFDAVCCVVIVMSLSIVVSEVIERRWLRI